MFCGMDGVVYEWDFYFGKCIGDCVFKFCSYYGVVILFDGKNIFVVGFDKILKEIILVEVNVSILELDNFFLIIVI